MVTFKTFLIDRRISNLLFFNEISIYETTFVRSHQAAVSYSLKISVIILIANKVLVIHWIMLYLHCRMTSLVNLKISRTLPAVSYRTIIGFK